MRRTVKVRYYIKPDGRLESLSRKKLGIIGTNLDGLNQKSDSLHKTIEELMLSVFMIHETKFSRKGKFRANHYEIFEQIRTQKGGSGLVYMKIFLLFL